MKFNAIFHGSMKIMCLFIYFLCVCVCVCVGGGILICFCFLFCFFKQNFVVHWLSMVQIQIVGACQNRLYAIPAFSGL